MRADVLDCGKDAGELFGGGERGGVGAGGLAAYVEDGRPEGGGDGGVEVWEEGGGSEGGVMNAVVREGVGS